MAPQGCWGLVKHSTFTGLAVCSKLVTCVTAAVGKAPECLAYVHTATIAIFTWVSPCMQNQRGAGEEKRWGADSGRCRIPSLSAPVSAMAPQLWVALGSPKKTS